MNTIVVHTKRDPLQVLTHGFTFRTQQGGHGSSSGTGGIPFEGGLAQVKVESARFDYETGWHFVAKASNSMATAEYVDRVGAADGLVYFSQFDMHMQHDLMTILKALPEEQVHCTEEQLFIARACV